MKETIVVVDIETMGEAPYSITPEGVIRFHPILSLGAVLFSPETLLKPDQWSTFHVNFEIEGGTFQEQTKHFWDKQPAGTWEATRKDPEPEPIQQAMERFAEWLAKLDGKPTCCSFPSAFDWPYLKAYFQRTGVSNPFGLSAFCLKSYAATLLDVPYRACTLQLLQERNMAPTRPWTHHCLEDAIFEAEILRNLMIYKQQKARKQKKPSCVNVIGRK